MPPSAGIALPILLLGVEAVLHAGYVLHHRVNTDEPQHLHVAWSVAQGLLQYRDVFDNHSPLFSMLLAPLIGALGERTDIVLLARLAMIPLTLVTLALTWALGRSLFTAREALWGVAVAAAVPDFMLGSVEYRTDQLWTVLWLAALVVLLGGPLTRGRSFLFGLLSGAALATSMKTVLLLLSLGLGWVFLLVSRRRRGATLVPSGLGVLMASAVGGLLIVPGIVAGYLAAQGAADDMAYCVIWHNIVPHLGTLPPPLLRVLILAVGLSMVFAAGDRVARGPAPPGAASRRAILLLTAGTYYVLLQGAWPLLTRQDVLPFVPMAAVISAPFLLDFPSKLKPLRVAASGSRRLAALGPAAAILLMMLWTQRVERVDRDNGTTRQAAFLGEVLRLTRPGERVMDLRGEAIFRPRPVYFALEEITEQRLKRGLLRDDIPERLVENRTAVAVADDAVFPERGRAFLNANYVPIGGLRVAGRILGDPDSAGVRRFDIGVPQRYAAVGERGPATGRLDGLPYQGPRELAPGPHEYVGPRSEGRVAVVWAPAVEREGSPFWPSRRGQ